MQLENKNFSKKQNGSKELNKQLFDRITLRYIITKDAVVDYLRLFYKQGIKNFINRLQYLIAHSLMTLLVL